jgi:CBS domain-containing protein
MEGGATSVGSFWRTRAAKDFGFATDLIDRASYRIAWIEYGHPATDSRKGLRARGILMSSPANAFRQSAARAMAFGSASAILESTQSKGNAMIPGVINEILSHKSSQLWTVSPDATVFDAIQIMADKNVGAVLVMAEDKLIGIATERDYTRKVALKGKSSRDTQVREIVGTPPITVTPSHTVEECMKLMTAHRVRHLPVLDGGKVTGLVSIGDLVNWIITAQSVTIHQLESYITGHYPGSD